MKRLLIKGPMDYDMIERVIDFLSIIEHDEPYEIYLNSPGGLETTSQVLKELLDYDERVTIIACGEVSSSALFFFLSVKCKRKVLPGTMGIFHLPFFVGMEVNLDLTARDTKGFNKMSICDTTKYSKRLLKGYLSRKKIKQMKSNKDIHLSYKDLQKLLKKSLK